MKIGVMAQSRLERNIGLSFEQIRKMSTEEQIKYIESKTGTKLLYSRTENPTRKARGNAALGEERYRTMDEINSVIDSAIAKAHKDGQIK